MPTPFAPRIILSQNAHTDRHALARAHSTPPSLALRARIVLRAAEADTPTNMHIGRQLGGSHRTVGKWRRRDDDDGGSGLHDAGRAGRPRTILAPTRVPVISVASTLPQDPARPGTRWTLEEIVATGLDDLHRAARSRSSVWRLLTARARKPHTSAYWLHRHDAPVTAHAPALCQLSIKALDAYQHGRLVICGEEKTGRHVLERKAPPKPAQAGRRARRAHESRRHGTRVLINARAVATGQMAWTIGVTRKATDLVAHLQQAHARWPRMPRDDWVMDHLHTHGRLAVCRLVASGCQGPLTPHQRNTGLQRRAVLGDPSHRHVVPFTPKHGAWLNQAAWFFGVLPRRFLARGSFGRAKACAVRFEQLWQDDNARHAHPYRWPYTGDPFGRDTPCSRTRRPQRHGRAGFSPRSKRFERRFSPPRPYCRRAA